MNSGAKYESGFYGSVEKEDEMGSLYMDRGQGVRAAFEASSDLSGQDVAESLRLAKSLGIPEISF